MTRQSRLNSDFGREIVTDFTDHDNVRILAHNVAQSFLEGQVYPGIDGALRNPVNDILDGFFSCDNAGFRIIDVVDAAVHSCGFSRSGGPRDQNNAAGHIERIFFKAIFHPLR